jgi:hypothetical protein
MQVGSGGSKSFAYGRSSMRPALDDTRVSKAIRLTKNFDDKQHGESAQSETVEKHERLTTQNILFVKMGTATSKVPRARR